MAYQKEKVEPKGIVKVGDVFCGDYGYNRCSPTFYKVVRLTKKMVEVKELNKARVWQVHAINAVLFG